MWKGQEISQVYVKGRCLRCLMHPQLPELVMFALCPTRFNPQVCHGFLIFFSSPQNPLSATRVSVSSQFESWLCHLVIYVVIRQRNNFPMPQFPHL